ncbi:hypothetical protein [Marinomonas shanghaiensis]|uniref:hypothetical protein n=1 Tax=Marinomonas shanghaiensis TaxID=2202418 RepID=UPI003A8F3013
MINLIPHTESRTFDPSYRSEDVKFSPSGRRLAVVATDGCLLLFAVDLDARPIQVRGEVEFRSPRLIIPHGVEFISEDVLVVVNRNASIVFFKIPPESEWQDVTQIEPIHEVFSPLFGRTGVTRKLRERDLFCGPGSIRLLDGILYVTCNYMNTVSTFSVTLDEKGLSVQEGVVVAHEGLSVVDGVAISNDGSLMALSDHDHHRVAIYKRSGYNKNASAEEKLQLRFEPACSLLDIDMHFPHGLRFDDAGQVIYAVDAGGRYIQVFATEDNWQSDMHGSTVKTFGIELDAFNKSQEAVPEEHRPLEGGGKGLDIDPTGRILVVTCRNQSLRFFGIESRTADVSMTKPSQEIVSSTEESDIALSCLIDDLPSIWNSIVPWLSTAIGLAKIPPNQIHIHHVCELKPEFEKLFKTIGVNTHAVARFDDRNVYTNKIIQGETRFGNVRNIVLTDVDIVFTGRPPFENLQGFVAGKLVDMENPPLDILEKIFKHAGVGISCISSNEFRTNDFHKTFETVVGNFNGGFYVIPNRDFLQLSQRWGVWARYLLEHFGLVVGWDKHVDQMAFCLAVNELKLPVRVLNNLWNFPTHIGLPPVKTEPWIFHHHADLNEAFLLKPMADPTLQIAVDRVNSEIVGFKQRYGL